MTVHTRREPKSFQIVSDLGQLTAFVDPMKTRILRILQQQEATISQLAEMVEEPESTVAGCVRSLRRVGLLTEERVDDVDVYRATALVYNLRPGPTDVQMESADVTKSGFVAAHLESTKQEVVTSLTRWPEQRGNYESRRARMSWERAAEFNEKLVDLIDEYWGGPDHPMEGDPNDPLLALTGFWYRFPDEV